MSEIKGRILSKKNLQGIPGMIVKAYLKNQDGSKTDIGTTSAATNSDGVFTISTSSSSGELTSDNIRKNDLFFEVLSATNQKLIQSTEYTLVNDMLLGNVKIEISDIPENIVNAGVEYRVRGAVVEPNGDPVANKMVKAIDIGVGNNEDELGSTSTDTNGKYVINFSYQSSADGLKPNLKIKVFDPSDLTEPIASSPLILNAANNESINLVSGTETYKGKSEFQILSSKISSEISDASALTEKDIAILSNKHKKSVKQISGFVHAKRYYDKINSHFSTSLSASYIELLYGMISQGVAPSLNTFLLTDESNLTRTIEQAINDNIIDQSAIDDITGSDAEISEVGDIAVKLKSVIPALAVEDTDSLLYKTLHLAGIPDTDNKKKIVIEQYLANNDDLDAFWSQIESQFDSRTKDNLQYTFDLIRITGQNFELTEDLFGETNYNSVKDLASLTKDGWVDYFTNNSITPPDSIDGDTDDEVKSNYAKKIAYEIEDLFPTAVLFERIKDETGFGQYNEFAAFHANNPDFDLGKGLIDDDFDYTGITLSQEDFNNYLKALQRIYKLAPKNDKFDAIFPLWTNNLHSAMAITSKGEKAFLKLFDPESVNVETGRAVYRRAQQTSIKSIMTFAKYGKSFNNISTYVYNTFNFEGAERDGGPNLEELFGALDYCNCKECRSVLSPAAYLTDLLLFLQGIELDNGDNQNLLEVIRERREDLVHIKLNCENTSTAIPYIDLVNEALENKVAESTDYYQTSDKAENILAYPEHINEVAYDNYLSSAKYPWNLPFNLWLEEIRGYLDFLSLKRSDLLKHFPKPINNEKFSLLEVATESLGLNTLNRNIITSNGYAVNQLYGKYVVDFQYPDQGEYLKVENILRYGFLEYSELKDLLQSKFVTGNNNYVITFYNADEDPNPCKLSDAVLEINSVEDQQEFLLRLNRFNRLKDALGWTVVELDKTIHAFGVNAETNQEVFNNFIITLSQIQEIHEKYDYPVVRLLAWWFDIDNDSSYGEPSLYEEIFHNTAVFNPPVESFDGSDILDEATLSILQAGFGMKTEDIQKIVATFIPEEDDDMTDGRLSLIFRIGEFTSKLGITVDEYLWICEFLSAPVSVKGVSAAVDEVSPEDTLDFIETVEKIQSGRFSLKELRYLLLNKYDEGDPISPTYEDVQNFIGDLREALINIDGDAIVDPEDDLLKVQVAIQAPDIIDFSPVDDLIAIIDKSTSMNSGEQTSFFQEHTIYFPSPEKNTEAIQYLINTGSNLSVNERYEYFMDLHGLDYSGIATTEYPTITSNYLKQLLNNGIVDIITSSSALDASEQSTIIAEQQTAIFDSESEGILVQQNDTGIIQQDPNYIWGVKARLNYAKNLLDVSPDSRSEEIIKRLLSGFMDSDNVEVAFGIINKTSELEITQRESFIENNFNLFVDPNEASELLLDEGDNYLEALNARYYYVNSKILDHLKKRVLYKKFAEEMNVDIELMSDMLNTYTVSPVDPAKKAIDVYINDYFTDSFISSIAVEEQMLTYLRIYKAAMIINKHRVNTKDAKYIFNNLEDGSWLNFYNLKVNEDGTPVDFNEWLHLNDAFGLQERYFTGELSLFGLINMIIPMEFPNPGGYSTETFITDKETFLEKLSEATGWKLEDVKRIVLDYYNFNLDEYRNERWIMRLEQAIAITNRLGVSASQIISWNYGDNDLDKAVADGVRYAVKAKYSDKKWLEIAPPWRNKLRIKQRDALQDYILARPGDDLTALINEDRAPDSNDLYDYFLLDTEMSPCAMTSRIKQATLTIQLFVQRILMNLEEGLTIDEPFAQQWEWRKNYRLWEANRKVFLYPENWLEPELRIGKSAIFKELEDKLVQEDITKENVERVYRDYLGKLDEIARLEIMSMFEENDNGNYILHVVARTYANPHKYYYRKWINKTHWTAWESIDVDIEGDHLSIVMWNGKLGIYWPIFIEKAIPSESIPFPQEDTNGEYSDVATPDKYFEIKLAWSLYENGKWGNKKVSAGSYDLVEDFIKIYKETFQYQYYYDFVKGELLNRSRKDLYFVPQQLGSQLWFLIYTINNDSYVSFDLLNKRLHGYAKIKIIDFHNEPEYEPQLSATMGYVIGGSPFRLFEGTMERINGTEIFKILSMENSMNTIHQVNEKYIFENLNGNTSFGVPYFNAEITEYQNKQIFIGNTNSDYINISINFPYTWGVNEKPPSFLTVDSQLNFPLILKINSGTQKCNNTLFVYHKFEGGRTSNFKGTIGPLIHNAIARASIDFTTNFGINPPEPEQQVYFGQREAGFIINREDSSAPAMMAPPPDVLPEISTGQQDDPPPGQDGGGGTDGSGITFSLFEHPYTGLFLNELNNGGIDGLLNPSDNNNNGLLLQQVSEKFFDQYHPNEEEGFINLVDVPVRNIDFGASGAYSLYNWELFYHIPVMIANRLSQNQQFAEARRWYHYVFDPTFSKEIIINTQTKTVKFWKLRPFFEISEETGQAYDIASLMAGLENDAELETLIGIWENDPFNPHLIADFRPVAKMVYVVVSYINNLVAWGDMLFRQDTMESINEAVQMYILAAKILGRRPLKFEGGSPEDRSFVDVNSWDEFGNVLREIEDYFSGVPAPIVPWVLSTGGAVTRRIDLALSMIAPALTQTLISYAPDDGDNEVEALYYCIPENDKLLSLWDTVGDRLFKIRHCMNIEGIVRQLPLFQPPIDPGLLIKAKAAGLDISTALSDLNAPLPLYRFRHNLQKAIELTNEVKALGGALLSALEKKDSEDMAVMRAVHQEELFNAMELIREKAIEEAGTNIESLQLSRKLTEERKSYYSSREYINSQEKLHLDKLEQAMILDVAAQGISLLSGMMSGIPQFTIGAAGFGGSPYVTTQTGGLHFANLMQSGVQFLNILASIERYQANKASIKGGYDRRMDDWQHQTKLAELELPQIDKQITAAELRLAMAEKELENLQLQVEQAQTELEFMQNKFTNSELYNWMSTQLSTLYFQSYQLAYDMAKRAEKALEFELGLDSSDYIQFGYWNNLKKGLLAGEKLYKDLQRLDIAYMEQNKRQYEVTKHVSLAMLNPGALIALRNTGKCIFDIPEVLYDLDYPGQYFRRIKSVSISIPAVTGPYTNVSCRLTMQQNRYRKTTDGLDQYAYKGINDLRFVHNLVGIQSIATSSGQNDSGLFRFDFNDERYLPFEGAGAIGTWALDMPNEFRQFDYDTIADVILHINYTAREGGETVKTAAVDNIDEMLNMAAENGTVLTRIFSMKAEFPDALHEIQTDNASQITFNEKHFPYFVRNKNISINSILTSIRPEQSGAAIDPNTQSPELGAPLTLTPTSLNGEDVDDIWIVVNYQIS